MQIAIQFLCRHAEDFLHLLKGFLFCTVRRHGKRRKDRERGKQRILPLFGTCTEETQRKVCCSHISLRKFTGHVHFVRLNAVGQIFRSTAGT